MCGAKSALRTFGTTQEKLLVGAEKARMRHFCTNQENMNGAPALPGLPENLPNPVLVIIEIACDSL
ncbi:hypothetical protein KDA_61390 [Dictyobacter alpinus]|uniref:Uncharacterized protein n=1 Tax=Dictyobacter alpinus TaxID=2014873 RepID=A0A402BH02_9CHLR|nr:hypothetical protein KDA_61390 [Dictyobacter alpinus]